MLSPENFNSNSHVNVVNVRDSGNLNSRWETDVGGVHYIFQILKMTKPKFITISYGEILVL